MAVLSWAGEKAGGSHQEHAGEHAGQEHAGKEHAGEEHVEETMVKKYNEDEIRAALTDYVNSQTMSGKMNFKIEDPRQNNKVLELQFSKIHPVRFLNDGGYFACTDFTVPKDKNQIYDLDFWLYPKEGSLQVTKSSIHKHPVNKDGKWKQRVRYTFNGDEMVPVK